MTMPNRKLLIVAIGAAIQSMAVQGQEPQATNMLEEVVVTATRRDESVLDIPYNITALTADRLDAAGVTDISGMIRMVPGLSTFDEGPRTSGNRNNFTIRGLNASALGNEDDNPRIGQATVSTYINETPIFFPLKLVDLERIEVLRGPQGTLYGSGSVGGTVRYIQRKPEFEKLTFDLSLEGSSTDEADDLGYDTYLIVNAPISDNMALRGSFGYESIPGFIDAVNLAQQTGTPRNPGTMLPADPSDPLNSPVAIAPPRKDVNEGDITFARVALRGAPTDSFEFNLAYHFQESSAESRWEDNPDFGTGEEFVIYKFNTDPQDNELNLISADLEFDFGFARLTSATGYADVDVFSVSDSSGFLRTNLAQYYFGYPRIISPIIRNQSSDTFTQEIRLVSQGDGPVQWVGGIFYLKNDLKFDLFQPMPGINDYTNAYFGLNPPLDFTDVLATGGTDQEFTDKAIFGEVSWSLTDQWQITLGARFFSQELKGTSGIPLPFASRTIEWYYYGTASNDFLLGGINPTTNDDDDSVFKFNTSYQVNDETLAFFTFAQGFRAGGANQLPEIDPFGNNNSDILRFDSDTADNYEIGLKGSWNNRFTYTATLYYVEWEDFQTTLSSLFGIAYVDNIKGAESKGLEFELQGSLTENLYGGLSYSYIDAETSDPFEQVAGDPSTIVPAGTSLPGAADHNLFANLEYRQPLANGSSLIYYTDFAYRSDTTSAYRDQPAMASENFAKIDSFTIWNASLSWVKEKYTITVFGENLTNDRATSIVSTADFFGAQDAGFGVIKPRTFGLRFKWSH